MSERVPAEVFPPCELIKEELEARGWTRETLSKEMDCSLRLVDETLANKRRITLMTAHMLGKAFGTGAKFWQNLQLAYDNSVGRHYEKGGN